ncbi:hypothetical protein CP8484711_0767B, partial [Chlamydia psittaci 84-8471/1]
EIE